MKALVDTAGLLRGAGLACPIVSAGGTGTLRRQRPRAGRHRDPGRIRTRLMDTDYGDVGVPFVPAFFVLGTVVSRPALDRIVLDCGHKSATKDHGHPAVEGIPGARVTAFNDEHAVVEVPHECTLAIGDRVRLRPSHTDPTVNLHDVFYAVEGDRVVDVWPIAARGYPEHQGVWALGLWLCDSGLGRGALPCSGLRRRRPLRSHGLRPRLRHWQHAHAAADRVARRIAGRGGGLAAARGGDGGAVLAPPDSTSRFDVLKRFGLLSAVGGLAGALLYTQLGPSVLGRVLGALLLTDRRGAVDGDG